jgi:hypothetical protein
MELLATPVGRGKRQPRLLMATELAVTKLWEFDEFGDVILRIQTPRGSTPVVIVDEGHRSSAQDIGEQILDTFKYLIDSEVFNRSKEHHDSC